VVLEEIVVVVADFESFNAFVGDPQPLRTIAIERATPTANNVREPLRECLSLSTSELGSMFVLELSNEKAAGANHSRRVLLVIRSF
jgi:hypothetical protein